MKFKLLVFDWDGTLMDSEARIVSCMQKAFADQDLPVPGCDAVRDIIGLGLREAILVLAPGLPDETIDRLFDGYRSHFLHKSGAESPLFPGVEETLDLLAEQGYLMAVATGKGRRGLDRVLDETGLGRYFIATRCADETFSKPHPEMLNQLIEFAGVDPAETLVIGDTEYDMQMANNAGSVPMAVSYGVHEVPRLLQHAPMACLNSIRELPGHLSVAV
jgi:phosphoglycolate phosphatase